MQNEPLPKPEPTMAERRAYALALCRKQLGCDAAAAEARVSELERAGKFDELVEAGRESQIHIVRRLLGLPAEQAPEAPLAVELAAGEYVEFDEPLTITAIAIPAIVHSSQGGRPPVPIVTVVLEEQRAEIEERRAESTPPADPNP